LLIFVFGATPPASFDRPSVGFMILSNDGRANRHAPDRFWKKCDRDFDGCPGKRSRPCGKNGLQLLMVIGQRRGPGAGEALTSPAQPVDPLVDSVT
jgi:hypothetical protein